MKLTILSLGAGVQSTTLALMAVEGVLPKPDLAIFADTGWEPSRVYAHLARLGDVMSAVGIPLAKVSKGNLRTDSIDPLHRYASVPYFVLAAPFTVEEPIDWRKDPCDCPKGLTVSRRVDAPSPWPEGCDGETHWVPIAWETRDATMEERKGMGRRQCTSEYKLGPINRHVRRMLGAEAPDFRRVPKGNIAEQWIGFSADEIGRVSDKDGVSYINKRYPLIEMGMSRSACEAWLARRGWTTVAKSACLGCPYHGNAQWRALRDTCGRCGHHRTEHRQWANIVGACEMLASSPEAGRYTHGMCGCHEFINPEWDDAVEFDEQIRKGGARGLPLDGEAFLHRSRVPLSIAPIDHRTRNERRGEQLDLVDELGDPDGCGPYSCRSGVAVKATPSDQFPGQADILADLGVTL